MQSIVMNWTNPTTDTDGNPYGANDNAGYTITIDGSPGVSVPLAFGTTFDIGTLDVVKALKSGPHAATLALVSKQGIEGAAAGPVTFSRAATPMAPANLAFA